MAQTPQSMSNEPLYDAVYRNVLLGLDARTDVITTSKNPLTQSPPLKRRALLYLPTVDCHHVH